MTNRRLWKVWIEWHVLNASLSVKGSQQRTWIGWRESLHCVHLSDTTHLSVLCLGNAGERLYYNWNSQQLYHDSWNLSHRVWWRSVKSYIRGAISYFFFIIVRYKEAGVVSFHRGCLGRHIIRPLRLSIWSPFHPLVHKAVPAPTANVSYSANYVVYNLKPLSCCVSKGTTWFSWF